MKFDKYRQRGAYHWKEYRKQTIYGKHANKVKDWIRKGRTLDIGAGDGLITFLIGAEGIDNNKLAVRLAKERNVNVKAGSAYDLKYPDSVFDNVLMADVIEHLGSPKKSLSQVRRVLKEDGYLYIVTPPAKKKGLHDKYHYREYTPNELVLFMGENGFELVGDVEVVPGYHRMYVVFRKI